MEVGVGGQLGSVPGAGGRHVGDLCGVGERVGGQGFAYDTDAMINRPRFNRRARRIITVAQNHGALHESVQEAECRTRRRCKDSKERKKLRLNGSFARFGRAFCATLARRRSHSRSALVQLDLGGLDWPGRPRFLCLDTLLYVSGASCRDCLPHSSRSQLLQALGFRHKDLHFDQLRLQERR